MTGETAMFTPGQVQAMRDADLLMHQANAKTALAAETRNPVRRRRLTSSAMSLNGRAQDVLAQAGIPFTISLKYGVLSSEHVEDVESAAPAEANLLETQGGDRTKHQVSLLKPTPHHSVLTTQTDTGAATAPLKCDGLPPDMGPRRRTVTVDPSYDDSLQRGELLGHATELFGGTDWQLEQIGPIRANGTRAAVVVRGHANPTPGRTKICHSEMKPSDSQKYVEFARGKGKALIEFAPEQHYAVIAELTPWVEALRSRVSDRMRSCAPWDVELEASWVVDEPGQPARVDTIVITRAPEVQGDLNKQTEFWLANVVPVIPGAGDGAGWIVEIDLPTGRVTLRYGVPTTLPTTAPFAWSVIDNGTWGDIAVGDDGDGRPVVLDLSANPHTLVVGKTGSGKSIFLEAIIYNALVHGWELAIVDPTKRGLDFRWARPYVRTGGWGCQSYTAALEVLRGVYEEGKRRLDLLDSLDIPKWTELSQSQRSEHNVVPVLVVLDEATSFAKLEPVLRALAPDDPERVEAEEINADKQRGMALISKIARECRYVGIHLVVGTQRFSVQDIGDGAGGLRENLGNRVLLGRASQTAVSMALAEPADAVSAYTQAHGVVASSAEPDSKERRPGRGIAEMDGMPTTAFQGWYASHDELVKELLARGIKKSDPPAKNLATAPSVEGPDDASVIDLGDISFSLDELEAADEASEGASPQATEPPAPSLDELWPDD